MKFETRSCVYHEPEGPFLKGQVVETHVHENHHDTWVLAGGFRIEAVEPDGTRYDVEHWADSNNVCDVGLGCVHKLTALVDGSVYRCVFAKHHYG